MKNNKKILTLIIVLIIIVIFAIAGVAYTYFCTDVFKSDKQKFFKYMSQTPEIFSGLESEELTQYYSKKNTNVYKYYGEFSAKIDEQTASMYMPNQRVYGEVENSKIVFDGERNKQNQYSHGTVAMKYSNGEEMKFEYINKEDSYGLKIDKILKKYLVLEESEFEEFAQKLAIPSFLISKVDAKNSENYKFTDEEKKALSDKIYKILDENLTDSMFKQEKLGDNLKYTLSLTASQIENIASKIFETIINDENVMNKLKQYYVQELNVSEEEADQEILELKESAEKYKERIKTNIEESDSDKSLDTELIQISAYTNKRKLINIELVTDEARASLSKDADKVALKIEKAEKDGESIVYNPLTTISFQNINEADSITQKFLISMEEYNFKVEFDANYKGIKDAEGSEELYTLQFEKYDEKEEQTYSMNYTANNKVSFENEIEEEDIKSNGVKINDYDEAKLQSTIEKVVSMVDQLNSKQMQDIGLEKNQNPIIYMFPFLSPFSGNNNVIEKSNTAKNNQQVEAVKEATKLKLQDLNAEYLEEQISNRQMNMSLDEYIDSNLSNASVLNELQKEISNDGYTASYDKNVGIVFTSKTDGSKLTCKIQNGKDVWSN